MSRAIPPSPPEMQTPLVGVLRFWGSGWCGRSHWFDEFAGSEFGRRRRPRAQRGVRLRDEPSNPTLSARNANAPCGRFAFWRTQLAMLGWFSDTDSGSCVIDSAGSRWRCDEKKNVDRVAGGNGAVSAGGRCAGGCRKGAAAYRDRALVRKESHQRRYRETAKGTAEVSVSGTERAVFSAFRLGQLLHGRGAELRPRRQTAGNLGAGF